MFIAWILISLFVLLAKLELFQDILDTETVGECDIYAEWSWLIYFYESEIFELFDIIQ